MTEKLLGPLSKRPWTERWLTRLLGAALSSAAYLLCLPWELREHPGPAGPGDQADPVAPVVPAADATPVTASEAAALAVCLLLLAAYFGRRDALAWPLLLVAAPPATLMYVSFHTHRGPSDMSESPWSLTWASATLAIAAGVLVATSVARRFRQDTEESLDGLVTARRQPAPCRTRG
ncbi:hypothetical protein [Streptomyces sp. 8P21H-1]|uniref:hypothetical protein n=1 Tax=Streptomyces sp. 8P21H-1 TaxID=2737048 RepID=UPI0015701E51|nr:hypothetical protein [Streptomyces sp. 8P21H-1]NSL43608.1 hypothetical protein [Streptomyces sp. 8P21H-1]